MWICDTKAYGNGLRNIKYVSIYVYALLYVVEGRPHNVDTCLSTHVVEGAILNHSGEIVNEKPLTPLQAQRWSQ
jgi:hypothetical protein